MNLKQLETFYWAARLGSFAQAAHRLNATQSAVSMRILELEARIGVPLFDRSQRTARLTPQGALLMPHAEAVLLAADHFRQAASEKDDIVGYVRLGVAEIVALTWLPGLIRFVRKSYPRLQLELEVTLSHVIEEKLYAGMLDVAFAACEMSQSRFVSTPLETVQFSWMCSPALQAIPEVLTPQALSELPVIATSREWQFRGSTLAWLTSNEIHFRNLTICNTFRTAASLAMAELGFAYLPERLYRSDIEAGRLRRLRSDPSPLPLQIFAIRSLSGAAPSHIMLEKSAETAIADFEANSVSGSAQADPC